MLQILEEAAGPPAVHPHLHGDERSRILAAQRQKAHAAVGDGLVLENFAVGVQHTHGLLAVAKVGSYGDSCSDSCFRFYCSVECITQGAPAPLLPSYLFLLARLHFVSDDLSKLIDDLLLLAIEALFDGVELGVKSFPEIVGIGFVW